MGDGRFGSQPDETVAGDELRPALSPESFGHERQERAAPPQIEKGLTKNGAPAFAVYLGIPSPARLAAAT
jgi:hypothetical protein